MLTPFERTLMHGVDYDGRDLTGWYACEKFNGHRTRWTGSRLLSRRGHDLNAPAWVTASLPALRLDLELFSSKAGGHDEVSSILRSSEPDWSKLSLIAFDSPDFRGDYCLRNAALISLDLDREHISVSQVVRVANINHAAALFEQVIGDGGEGLILHKPESSYHEGRTSMLVKLLPSNFHCCFAH